VKDFKPCFIKMKALPQTKPKKRSVTVVFVSIFTAQI